MTSSNDKIAGLVPVDKQTALVAFRKGETFISDVEGGFWHRDKPHPLVTDRTMKSVVKSLKRASRPNLEGHQIGKIKVLRPIDYSAERGEKTPKVSSWSCKCSCGSFDAFNYKTIVNWHLGDRERAMCTRCMNIKRRQVNNGDVGKIRIARADLRVIHQALVLKDFTHPRLDEIIKSFEKYL